MTTQSAERVESCRSLSNNGNGNGSGSDRFRGGENRSEWIGLGLTTLGERLWSDVDRDKREETDGANVVDEQGCCDDEWSVGSVEMSKGVGVE